MTCRCGKPATHKVTATIGKCSACHAADRAEPWATVTREIDDKPARSKR